MYFMQEPALYPVVKITFLSAAASGSLLKCLFLTLQNKKIVPLWGLFQLHTIPIAYMEYRACFCYCNFFPRVCIFEKICFQLAKRELKCNFFVFFVCVNRYSNQCKKTTFSFNEVQCCVFLFYLH